MPTNNRWRTASIEYAVAAVIVWVALLIACAVILRGTPYFGQLLPILGGGAVFFVIVLPAAVFRTPRRRERAGQTERASRSSD